MWGVLPVRPVAGRFTEGLVVAGRFTEGLLVLGRGTAPPPELPAGLAAGGGAGLGAGAAAVAGLAGGGAFLLSAPARVPTHRTPATISATEPFLMVLRITGMVIGYPFLSRSLSVAPHFGFADAYSMLLTFPLVKVTFIFMSV